VFPDAGQLVRFDERGFAVLRGRLSGDLQCQGDGKTLSASITVEVPVLVQGVDAYLEIPYSLSYDTQIASTATPFTRLRDFLAANPEATTSDAFAVYETIDVVFSRDVGHFDAVALRQAEPADVASWPVLDGILAIDFLSRGRLDGLMRGANWDGEFMTWTVALPVDVQGIEADLLLTLRSTANTRVVTAGGQVLPPTTPDDHPADGLNHPSGDVRVEFTLRDGWLEADRFIEITP
jgi:hypothetical protein